MAQRRDRIPGLNADAERSINQLSGSLDTRLKKLEAKRGRAGVVLADTNAIPGEFLNIEAPAAGLTVILPEPVPSLLDARVTLSFKTASPVRIVAIRGLVNGFPFVRNTAVGTFEAVCDGLTGWAVETGLSPTGSATDAEYVLGVASAGLPNGRVATDSTEIDAVLTTPLVISWALRAASVVFAKLQDLTGLSVLGRAANSAGVMAAITATAARQTLQVNDAGTALQWGNPLEAQLSGVDLGNVHTLNVLGGDFSAAGGAATLSFFPGQTTVNHTGIINALVLPSTLKNRDTYVMQLTGTVTLNGIDEQDNLGNTWPVGFEFVLGNNSSSFNATIVDESGSAAALDRISTPGDQSLALRNAFVYVRRFSTRWAVVERGWPAASTTIAYDVAQLQLQRAALTGAITAAANSNTTTFGPIAADSFIANPLGVAGVPVAHSFATLAGDGLFYTTGGILGVGAGAFITVAANTVAVNSITLAAALAGSGLSDTGLGVMQVGAGTFITVGANDVSLSTTSAGTVYGARFDAGAPEIVALTGLEQGENLQIGSIVVDTTSAGDQLPYTGFASPRNCLVFQNVTVNLRSMTARPNTMCWMRHSGSGTLTIQDEDGSAAAGEAFSTGCGALLLRNDQQALWLHTNGAWRLYGVTTVLPTEAELQLSSMTGNMGTIDIDAVPCGGTVRIGPAGASSAYSIEGFSKTIHVEGFWFHFSLETGLTNHCTLFHNDATATTSNRMWLPLELDITAVGNLDGIFYYRDNRWRWCSANPNQIGVNATNYVRVTGTGVAQVNIATSSGDITIDAGGDLAVAGDVVRIDATNANGTVSITSQAGVGGGSLQLTEQASSGANVAAGRGMFWVQNQAPSAPMYTDDTNLDREIATIGAPVTRGTAASFSTPFIIGFLKTSGTGAAGDDIVFNANAPFAFRIIACGVVVSTAVAASTVQWRSASGGGGNTFSVTMGTGTAGLHTSAGIGSATSLDLVVPAGGSLVARWSDIDVRAYIWAMCVRT